MQNTCSTAEDDDLFNNFLNVISVCLT